MYFCRSRSNFLRLDQHLRVVNYDRCPSPERALELAGFPVISAPPREDKAHHRPPGSCIHLQNNSDLQILVIRICENARRYEQVGGGHPYM